MDKMTSYAHLLLDFRLRDVNWPTQIVFAIVVAFSIVLSWWTLAYLTSPLRNFPGPFLAGWTNLWRLSVVRSGKYPQTIKKLHDKYGPVLRIGPNTIDLDMPELVKTIYTTDGKWLKTAFYHNSSTVINGNVIYNLFSTPDPASHAAMKRPIAKHYSIGGVLAMEPLMDGVIGDLCKHLEERFIVPHKEVDLGRWITYWAWDTVGVATFSEDFRYMRQGCDHDGTLSIAEKAADYFSAVGQMPWLDSILDKNPYMRNLGPPNLANVTAIALQHIADRRDGKDPNFDPAVPDYLHRFLECQRAEPGFVHDGMILNYVFVNLIAGADTTAITIRSALYFLMRDLRARRKLEEEILGAGIGLEDVVPYNVARALPYLEAVIRESIRLHPGVSMLLERTVPTPGLPLPTGPFVPAGTSVGINPYVLGRNPSVYGPDADTFRPERWLPHDGETVDSDSFKDRLRTFNAADLAFGAGSRICMGRHFASVETYKMVATLVRRYEMRLENPDKEWHVVGIWFPRQSGIICRLEKRPA